MADQRQPTPAAGVFDRKSPPSSPSEPAAVPVSDPGSERQVKPNFPDPFVLQSEMKEKTLTATRAAERKIDQSMSAATQAQDALNKSGFTELEEDAITAEDMKLAEQLIFRGYAETNIEMPNFPGRKFTICSTNAEEIAMIDDMAFDMVNDAKKNEDGTVDIPENHVRALRNALFVALSYRGCEGKELMSDPTYHLNTLKKAILTMNDYLNSGDLDSAQKLKASIKKALKMRGTAVKRLPTTLIDFLSSEKYKFDNKMSTIMSQKKILPKS